MIREISAIWKDAISYSQIPQSKLRGIKLAAQQGCGVSDPRGSRQIAVQARLLGSLPAEIENREWI